MKTFIKLGSDFIFDFELIEYIKLNFSGELFIHFKSGNKVKIENNEYINKFLSLFENSINIVNEKDFIYFKQLYCSMSGQKIKHDIIDKKPVIKTDIEE